MARDFAQGGDIPPAYWRPSRVWNTAGAVATLLPLIAVFLRVMKPI